MRSDPTNGRLRALEMWLGRRLEKNDSISQRAAVSMQRAIALRAQQRRWNERAPYADTPRRGMMPVH
ncbi:MAG TPA: hypothetical protein VHC22_22575 [Pirellulales bacterium]|nr:hypothetical protein [Pirellulales bacterium]